MSDIRSTRREVLVMGITTALTSMSGLLAVLWRRRDLNDSNLLALPATAPPDAVAAQETPDSLPSTDPATQPAEPSFSEDTPDAEEVEPLEESSMDDRAADAAQPAAGQAAVLSVLCRQSWGAAAAAEGRPHVIDQITVHHSASALPDNRQIVTRLRSHQRAHQQANGWTDLAYHFVVDANGNVFQGRSLDEVGDTSTDYDPTGHLLAMCEGNFEEHAVPEAQLDGLARLLAWATQAYRVPLERITGHRDHAATACPGRALQEHLTSGELRRRVERYAGSGPIAFHIICGSEAQERIRAIEAG